MINSFYIGNVEFVLESNCEICFTDCLEEYLRPILPVERTITYHIKYEQQPKPLSFQPITSIEYPPHLIGRTETGECRIYSDIITGYPKVMYNEISLNEVELCFYSVCPSKCVISLNELNYLAIERQMIKARNLVLHSSFVEVNGKAILFTAPSGTGKSTQADLWKNFRNAEVVNGDRTLLVKTQTGFVAAGFPFSGSSGIFKNRILDIVAIVMICQAPRTSGQKEGIISSFKRIYPEIVRNYWDLDYEETVIEVLNELLPSVQKISLACTMGVETVECLEKIMIGEITNENN